MPPNKKIEKMLTVLDMSKYLTQPDMVMHSLNSSTREAEAGSEFEASLVL